MPYLLDRERRNIRDTVADSAADVVAGAGVLLLTVV